MHFRNHSPVHKFQMKRLAASLDYGLQAIDGANPAADSRQQLHQAPVTQAVTAKVSRNNSSVESSERTSDQSASGAVSLIDLHAKQNQAAHHKKKNCKVHFRLKKWIEAAGFSDHNQ